MEWHEGRFTRDSLPVFSVGSSCEQLWHGGRGCPLLDDVHPAVSRRSPPYKVPWGMVLERLSWLVTCPNHASFRLLT